MRVVEIAAVTSKAPHKVIEIKLLVNPTASQVNRAYDRMLEKHDKIMFQKLAADIDCFTKEKKR